MPQTQTTKIPKLRFPGFSGEWEEKRLSEVTEKISDGLHSTPIYDDSGEFFFINGNNLINGHIVIDSKTKRVHATEFEKYKKDLGKNTILLSINGTIGNLALYNNEQVVLGKSACYINVSKTININFLYNYLQHSSIASYYDSELTGSTIQNLGLTTIKKTPLNLPSLPEQTKIASFLSQVEKKINNLTTLKFERESYKKGAMQQIFSQQIRFKDDGGEDFAEWEEKKLGEICEINKGQQLNRDELTEVGTYPALNGGISPSGYTEKYNKNGNTITISEGGNSCGYVSYLENDFWCGGHCYALENLKCETSYLYQVLKFYESEIMKLRVGSGLPNIQKKDIYSFEIPYPSLLEQQKIANFLSGLDKKIIELDKQIEQMKQRKKGLLQGLFI